MKEVNKNMIENAFLEGYYDAYLEDAYNDEFLDGYYDALEEAQTNLNLLPVIGGGDLKGDIKDILTIGNQPERAAAVKYYMDNGNTFKGAFTGGIYGNKNGMPYRKHGILPGSSNYPAISNSTVYDNIYLHLNPTDRERIMKDYMKKNKNKFK